MIDQNTIFVTGAQASKRFDGISNQIKISKNQRKCHKFLDTFQTYTHIMALTNLGKLYFQFQQLFHYLFLLR